MIGGILMEFFSYLVFSFIWGVIEKYNFDEFEFIIIIEVFGYNIFESIGWEWYYYLIDEFIY